MDSKLKDDLIKSYKLMKCIRLFEEKLDWLFSKGQLGGTTHLCIGQEAVAVGVIKNLNITDYVLSSHRGHGHMIAKGGNIQKMFSELMGKIDGYCYGKGGTQHLCAKDIGFYGTNGITGGGIPIATGIALSNKLKNNNAVVVSFFGDGATNQGTFHESLNMASVWDLPIIYVCENNFYGMSTHVDQVTACESFVKRAEAYNIKADMVDGMDVLKVIEISKKATDYVRKQKKPFLIEAQTYRYGGHSKSDARLYRTKEEEKAWGQKDCIQQLKNYLLSEKVQKSRLDQIDEEINQEIEKALVVSQKSEMTPETYALEGAYKNE